MNQFSRNLMLWAIIVLATVMLFNMFQQPQSNVTRVPFTEFLNKVDEGQLVSVTMQGQTLTGRTADNHSIQTYAPRDTNLVQRLIEKRWKSRPNRRKNPPGT